LDGPAHPDPRPVPEDVPLPTGKVGLLLHEDDLNPTYLTARGLDPVDTAVLIAPNGRSPLQVSGQVQRFTQALAEDALANWNGSGPVTDDIEEIIRWASGFDHIVTPYAPTGPLCTALDQSDLRTVRPIREWDSTAWAFTTAGFFKVKAKMATILETIPADLR
ncbi:MAG: DNA photolyase, partial [Pseudomonadota bacterium]